MNFDEILSRCIIEMERGASIEECLSRYPAFAHNLEPLLRIALELRTVAPVRMSNSAFDRGQQALRAQLQENRRVNEIAEHRRPPFLRNYRHPAHFCHNPSLPLQLLTIDKIVRG